MVGFREAVVKSLKIVKVDDTDERISGSWRGTSSMRYGRSRTTVPITTYQNLHRSRLPLGLAVKLLHRYGSSELVKLLHEHGFTTSYDEALRFRKSTARLLADNAQVFHQFMGLYRTVSVVFAWIGDLDHQVLTPNG